MVAGPIGGQGWGAEGGATSTPSVAFLIDFAAKMQHRPLFLAAACRLVVLGSTSAAAPAAHVQCSVLGPGTLHFCSGVTWNASLPLPASSLDKAAKADFELALDRLHRLGSTTSLPMCLESWKALQCASKFQKCSSEQPAQKVRASAFFFHPTCFPGAPFSFSLGRKPEVLSGGSSTRPVYQRSRHGAPSPSRRLALGLPLSLRLRLSPASPGLER